MLLGLLIAGTADAQSSRHPHSTSTPTPAPAPVASPSATGDALSAQALGLTPATPELPEPVASVDGNLIHAQDLERVTKALLATNGRTLEELSPAERQKAFRSVLDDVITDRLVANQAINEQVSDVDIEKHYDGLRTQYRSQGAFDAEVKRSGQTPEQVRRNIRTQLAQEQWLEHKIAPEITVSQEEIEKFYKESPPDKFNAPEMVRASHILVAVAKDAPPEEAFAAENKANALYTRLKNGESFDKLARENSDDAYSKDKGGDLDYFSRERIIPEIGEAAFKLKVGEISPPVRSNFGFHLVKVTDRKPAHLATLDEARDQIAAYLRDEKRRIAITKVVQELHDRAKIQIFLD